MQDAKKIAKELRNEATVLQAKANKLIDAAKILEDMWNGDGNGRRTKEVEPTNTTTS
jgi:hypothetical protein